ncbi:unnamed protein product, partial [Ectocarpus sp. 12 AP-2014]
KKTLTAFRVRSTSARFCSSSCSLASFGGAPPTITSAARWMELRAMLPILDHVPLPPPLLPLLPVRLYLGPTPVAASAAASDLPFPAGSLFPKSFPGPVPFPLLLLPVPPLLA